VTPFTDNEADAAERLEQRLAEQDLAESMASALADSDTASELLHDQAADEQAHDARGFGRPRLLLGVLGLLAVALSGARRARKRR
jgi:hypothetical protein